MQWHLSLHAECGPVAELLVFVSHHGKRSEWEHWLLASQMTCQQLYWQRWCSLLGSTWSSVEFESFHSEINKNIHTYNIMHKYRNLLSFNLLTSTSQFTVTSLNCTRYDTKTTECRPLDQSLPHLPWTVMLPPPVYFAITLTHHLNSLFNQMSVVITT